MILGPLTPTNASMTPSCLIVDLSEPREIFCMKAAEQDYDREEAEYRLYADNRIGNNGLERLFHSPRRIG